MRYRTKCNKCDKYDLFRARRITSSCICHMWSHSSSHLRNFTSAKHSNLWMNALRAPNGKTAIWKAQLWCTTRSCAQSSCTDAQATTAFVMLHATWLNALFHTSFPLCYVCAYRVLSAYAVCVILFFFSSLHSAEIRLMQSAIEQMMENYKPI